MGKALRVSSTSILPTDDEFPSLITSSPPMIPSVNAGYAPAARAHSSSPMIVDGVDGVVGALAVSPSREVECV